MPLASVLKPEYVFRPSQLLRRFRHSASRAVVLPWGKVLVCDPQDAIGKSIRALGVYDLPVTEALWRLTGPEDVAADAGAHVGYMTSVLSARARKTLAFEPHPTLFRHLSENVTSERGDVALFNCALSDREGTAILCQPEGFAGNSGLARIAEEDGIPVRLRRLDGVTDRVDVLKIDVEGHELPALVGADSFTIRDIIFEEHSAPPTPVTEYLKGRGYAIFPLGQRLLGPSLTRKAAEWQPRNYLATLDPARARARFKPFGWMCLR